MAIESTQLPRFALIKQYLNGHIGSGDWPPGTRIPSEKQLSASFSVSRMTARRAVKELADAGLLDRTPGRGTFVSQPAAKITAVPISNVVAQAQAAGCYSSRLLSLQSVAAQAHVAELMQRRCGAIIFQLTIVHLNKTVPVQWQQLSVNPTLAPALLKQNFNKITPDAYLDWIAPSTSVDQQLSAVLATHSQRRELALSDEAVCMQVSRRNWSAQNVVSFSRLVHPARHYRLGVSLEA